MAFGVDWPPAICCKCRKESKGGDVFTFVPATKEWFCYECAPKKATPSPCPACEGTGEAKVKIDRMKAIEGWAIREDRPTYRHWPKEMPFPNLFWHKAEAEEKAKQLRDFGFPAVVVPVELHESAQR